jgi:cytochrome c oxidase subunit 2
MMRSLREVRHSLRASPGFALAVLITLGLAGLIGLMTFLMVVLGGFLGMAHFTEPQHRIHDLTYGFLFTTAIVGLLAQIRRPSNNVAGMLMALIPWVGLLLAAVLSTEAGVIRSAERMLVGMGTIIAAALHPARPDFFRSFRFSRINWVMLGLVVIAAVPLLAFASTNIGLQGTVTNEHAGMGHYGFMAAAAFTVIGVGLLASLRPDGWRLTAWVAGLLPALLGLASVVYPDVDSSLGLVWALAAIAWGVVFVAAAELTRDADGLTLLGSQTANPRVTTARDGGDTHRPDSPRDPHTGDDGVGADRGSATGLPRWVKVLGIVALVVALLVVILRLTGVGGEHGPGRHGDASSVTAGAVEIAVTADSFAFDPDQITVTTGEEVAIVLTSVDTLHDFTIDELDAHVAAERGEAATGGFRADRPGRYTFYCRVPGHRGAGMEGTFIVTEDQAPPGGDGE